MPPFLGEAKTLGGSSLEAHRLSRLTVCVAASAFILFYNNLPPHRTASLLVSCDTYPTHCTALHSMYMPQACAAKRVCARDSSNCRRCKQDALNTGHEDVRVMLRSGSGVTRLGCCLFGA